MNDWLIAGIYVLGVLHAVPAWYFGKAAGIKRALEIIQKDWVTTCLWTVSTTNHPNGEAK